MATLYDHQKNLIKQNPARSLLCWECGTGKTLAAIEWAQSNKNRRDILILCPKALKANWKREVKKHARRCNWLVMTKEEFRRDWKLVKYHDTVIVDEAHYFAGKSQMSKNLHNYLKTHAVPYRLLLTATPYTSSPWSIFILARLLGHEWNYMSFRIEFFTEFRMGHRVIPKIRPNIADKIAALVSQIGDVVRLDECFDVPEQIFDLEMFEVNKKQQKMIDDIDDVIPVVKYGRQHQIENGTLKSDGYTENKTFDYDKNERILELAQEHKKIAIVCKYNLQIEALSELLKKLKKPIYIINGKTKDSDKIVLEAEAADECIVIINAYCSVGYELPSIGMIVFASLSFSYVHYEQICGRFLRGNRLKKNVYLHLITDGVDMEVYKSIKKKEDFKMKIYAKNN